MTEKQTQKLEPHHPVSHFDGENTTTMTEEEHLKEHGFPPETMPEWEARAYRFAQRAHGTDLDDSGIPYFQSHVLKVVEAVKVFTNNKDIIEAAYLHDTVEDTETNFDDIEKEFGKVVRGLVRELTHEGKKDSIGHYFPFLRSPDAILIKLLDRASNVSRMDCWDKGRSRAYARNTKFWKAFPGDMWKERPVFCDGCGKATPKSDITNLHPGMMTDFSLSCCGKEGETSSRR